jgi:hypothetical protein
MIVAYRDAMLDWAVSELMSPHWRAASVSAWAHPMWEPWRAHVRSHGPSAWTPAQADQLIATLRSSRKPIISRYGPDADWIFDRRRFDAQSLSRLTVMADIFPPGGTVLQLAQWVQAQPGYAPTMSASIVAIMQDCRRNLAPFGTPIAVEGKAGDLTLIEGYKRVIAYLSLDRAETLIFVARAPAH